MSATTHGIPPAILTFGDVLQSRTMPFNVVRQDGRVMGRHHAVALGRSLLPPDSCRSCCGAEVIKPCANGGHYQLPGQQCARLMITAIFC